MVGLSLASHFVDSAFEVGDTVVRGNVVVIHRVDRRRRDRVVVKREGREGSPGASASGGGGVCLDSEAAYDERANGRETALLVDPFLL